MPPWAKIIDIIMILVHGIGYATLSNGLYLNNCFRLQYTHILIYYTTYHNKQPPCGNEDHFSLLYVKDRYSSLHCMY